VEFVGARLGYGCDNSRGHVAILSGEVAGFDAKLFQRVGGGQRVAITALVGDIVAAIQVEVNLGAAGIDRPVDLN
jgi:hypothetical protein